MTWHRDDLSGSLTTGPQRALRQAWFESFRESLPPAALLRTVRGEPGQRGAFVEIVNYDPPRPYARGVRAGDFIFLSGTVGEDPETHEIVPGGIVPQIERTFENVRESLQACGAGLDDIVKTTTFLINPDDWRSFQAVRRRYLSHPVASTMVWVKRLADDEMLVEVDVIAVAPGSR